MDGSLKYEVVRVPMTVRMSRLRRPERFALWGGRRGMIQIGSARDGLYVAVEKAAIDMRRIICRQLFFGAGT